MLKFLIHGLESVILPLALNPCLILVAEVSQSSTPLYSHEAPHSSNHEAEKNNNVSNLVLCTDISTHHPQL